MVMQDARRAVAANAGGGKVLAAAVRRSRRKI
jgi:hypothetical protein